MSFTNFSTGRSHSFGGTWLELAPHERIRHTDTFDDPNLPGEMRTTISLKKVSCGTNVDIVQEGIPDVIILDVMMPAMDGYEVCQKLKADPRTRGIPVILHTILKGTEVETRGEAAGADFVVHKPMRPLSLFLKTVEAALAKRRQPGWASRTLPPRP